MTYMSSVGASFILSNPCRFGAEVRVGAVLVVIKASELEDKQQFGDSVSFKF